MSASSYYSFITPADKAAIEACRQTPISPLSGFATSSSTSSSSLNQFNSLTQASSASSSSSSSSSSSTTATDSSNESVARLHEHREFRRQSSVTPPRGTINNHDCTSNFHNHQTTITTSSHHPQLFHSYTLQSLEPKPLKPFKSNGDYLEAMREDLAEWLNRLYPELDLTADNFFSQLETGSIICRHANTVTQMGRNLMLEEQRQHSLNEDPSPIEPNNNNIYHQKQNLKSHRSQSLASGLTSPKSTDASKIVNSINWFNVKAITFKRDASPGTFFARDNICQFILWCRSLNILECLLFETDDLVARKNEKSFILCLLEVARIGFKVGMPTPLIIQLEQEIDREIENDAKLQKQLEEKQNQDTDDTTSSLGDNCDESQTANHGESIEAQEDVPLVGTNNNEKQQEEEKEEPEEVEEDLGPKPQVITNDLVSLHEKVVQLLCQCTCATQFPMVRVGDNGKYKVGDKLIIFVRILRRHIMVRVGGGWQELSEFLRVKDPCRARLYQPHTHQSQQTGKLTPCSAVSNSRLVDSVQQLNKNAFGRHHNHQHYRSSGGQRLISGSASMSWLSNNYS